jgi:hypothetical protein
MLGLYVRGGVDCEPHLHAVSIAGSRSLAIDESSDRASSDTWVSKADVSVRI